MKNKLPFLIMLTLLAACSKNDSPLPTPPPKPLVVTDVNTPLYFKAVPVSASQLKISFQYDLAPGLSSLYMKKDTTTIGTYTLHNDGNGFFSTTVNYDFAAGQSYKLQVRSGAANDTAYSYTLPAYTHTYVGPFQYEKLLSLTQSLGPQAFDISPSRKTIFITDDVNNTLIVKKLSLTDGRIDTLPNSINGLMVRAVSDDEIISYTHTYNGRFLLLDSAVLMRYNLKTGQSSFIDFVSYGYGRFSRVIQDHMLAMDSYYASASSKLINLDDNSKITYPVSTLNFTGIREISYDHLYYLNDIVDPATGALQSKIPLPDSSGIEYIDGATQYAIVTTYRSKPAPYWYAYKLSVYSKTNSLVYDGDYVNGRSFQVGRQLDIGNNRILLHQSFNYDTTYHNDGYYSLDLNTQKLSLVQNDSNLSIMLDFQLDPHSLISVRADGVYRIKMP